MPKIISLTVLHYGTDFLQYALQSVHEAVDLQYVLYTPEGSHGHKSGAVCPDTREALIECAIAGAGDKLRWHEGIYPTEGQHRDMIHQLAPDADCIIVVDADEVYADGLAQEIRTYAEQHYTDTPKRLRVPFWHYWRSFKRGFMHDPALPERVIFPKIATETRGTFQTGKVIHHFGYAQRSEIVGYKLKTHGHKNEFRHDCDWFTDIFMSNRQYDCHPVGSDAWNCEDMDSIQQLPSVLANHPFKDLEVIP